MNRMKLHGLSLGILVVTIFLVTQIFKWIESREQAGLVAGLLFVLVGFLIVATEHRLGRGKNSAAFWTAILFLVGAALPIMGLRLSAPGQPFSELSLLGIPGPVFHKVSSWIYLAMLGGVIVEFIRDWCSKTKAA